MAGSVAVLVLIFLSGCLAQSNEELGIQEGAKVEFKDRGEKFDKDFAVLNKDNSNEVKAE